MPYNLRPLRNLTPEEIDSNIRKEFAGVYVLYIRGPIRAKRVGRSDEDLNKRIKDYLESKYKYFRFDYAKSPKDAFDKECELYHDYRGDKGKLDNERHPDKKEGSNWKCPTCGHDC